MNPWITTFVIAFVASLSLTAVVRAAAWRWRIVDYPDGKRKLHAMPVPLWGGVAVYLAVVLGLVVAGWASFVDGGQQAELSTVLIVAAGIVCFFGGIDDCWALNGRLKLLLQVCAVLPIVALGYYVDCFVAFGYPIELGWFGIPLTVAWLVGCINALNLLDGMDGLASTVGLLTAVMMAIIAVSMGNMHVAVIAVVLAGALAGFLIYNLPPASIFLGDSGSMVIGLILGVLGIQGAMKTSTTLAITVPAVIMSLPMFDMLLALVRRKLTGKRFDTADREHVHHRLLDRGLTQWQALCIIGALCLTTGAATTAATLFRFDALAWITALALMVLAIRLEVFGHHEMALVKRAIAYRLARVARYFGEAGSRRRNCNAADLAKMPFDDAWNRLLDELDAWKIGQVELLLSGQGEEPRQHKWHNDCPDVATAEDAAGDVDQRDWSIAMAFYDRDCRVCELRVTGSGTMNSDVLYTTGLTEVMMAFGTHFADHAEQIPARTPLRRKLGPTDDHLQRQSKAA